jgi:RNA polymerase sigma-70 factor (ECF subfamily)
MKKTSINLTPKRGQLPPRRRRRPLPFYAWLRRLAWKHLVRLHRRHVVARRRSVSREEVPPAPLPDASAWELASRLAARGSSSSARLRRDELGGHLRRALARLAENDREVLGLRYLEVLRPGEIAAVQEITEAAVKMWELRALQRLRELLGDDVEQVP